MKITCEIQQSKNGYWFIVAYINRDTESEQLQVLWESSQSPRIDEYNLVVQSAERTIELIRAAVNGITTDFSRKTRIAGIRYQATRRGGGNDESKN